MSRTDIASAEPAEERVPSSRIVVYSSPVLGVFMAGMLVSFYILKFSTDVLLVGPAVMGSILLGARVWDAVSDPWSAGSRTAPAHGSDVGDPGSWPPRSHSAPR